MYLFQFKVHLTLSTVVPLMAMGVVTLSLLLPVVHNQLFGFADVEMEVVILAASVVI